MNEKGKKSKVINTLVVGEAYKGISDKNGKKYSKSAPIVGYIIQTHDGKKAVMTKDEAIAYIELECDGEIANAELNVKKTKAGYSPYLQGTKEFGSLRQIEKRIDKEVTNKNGEKKTEILPEFKAKFEKVAAAKGKKSGKNPALDAKKQAEKRAAIREYLAKQKEK